MNLFIFIVYKIGVTKYTNTRSLTQNSTRKKLNPDDEDLSLEESDIYVRKNSASGNDEKVKEVTGWEMKISVQCIY